MFLFHNILTEILKSQKQDLKSTNSWAPLGKLHTPQSLKEKPQKLRTKVFEQIEKTTKKQNLYEIIKKPLRFGNQVPNTLVVAKFA
jgi:hypothetical protein